MYKKGKVVWFDKKKGFGFLISPEGKDVFIHFSSIIGPGYEERLLQYDEEVIYLEVDTGKSLAARWAYRASRLTPEESERLLAQDEKPST